MKKLFILSVCILGLSGLAKSQYSMDFGVSAGVSTYVGEIGNAGSDGFKPFIAYIEPTKMNVALGGFYRFNFTRRIAAKANINWVRIAGADSLSSEPTRIARNLSFRTDIIEFSLAGEYSFLLINDLSRKARIDFGANLYAGVGYMLFYPTAEYNGTWYDLRPLMTEGTENAYEGGSLIVPVGVGFNFTFSKRTRLGMDFGYRFTFTDYLDDVSTDYAYDTELPFVESQIFANRSAEAYSRGDADLPDPGFYDPGSRRGNPDTNDGYFTMQLQLSYVLDLGNNFYRSRYNSIINRRRKRTKF